MAEFLEIAAEAQRLASKPASSPFGPAYIAQVAEVFRSLPVELLRRAVDRAIREETFRPEPAVLLRYAGLPSAELRASLAWPHVLEAIRAHGSAWSVEFDDPLVHAAIRAIGGWDDLCRWTYDEAPEDAAERRSARLVREVQRDFERAYVRLAGAGFLPAEQLAYLPCALDVQNAGAGRVPRAPRRVCVGLPRAFGLPEASGHPPELGRVHGAPRALAAHGHLRALPAVSESDRGDAA